MADYQRWSIVLRRLNGGDLLDIGIGLGQFPDAAVRSRKFTRVRGADRKPHSEYRNLIGFEFVTYDLTTDPGDLAADVVTCMECIEHIPSPGFDDAVANLKRITRKRLIVTVPFEEPEPLPHYHFQRFDMTRLEKLFPGARIDVLQWEGTPWALVDWRPGSILGRLRMMTRSLASTVRTLRSRWSSGTKPIR